MVHKFRAWDNVGKQYAYIGYHVIGEITALGGMESYIHERRIKTGDARPILECWNDFEEEQWTGMVDRKGKDVYEGDIVTSDLFDLSPDVPAYVEYWDDKAAFIYKCPNDPMVGAWGYLKELVEGDMWIEVIGNIHQNKELLKGKIR